jgi:2-C-methyl-D-erythritol 4-phosphate cytidylyltransferase
MADRLPKDRLPAPVRFSAVVAAAGTGRRMGGRGKALLKLAGRPILYRAIEALRAAPGCAEIVPVLHQDEYDDAGLAARLRRRYDIRKTALGGPTRQASVLAGLELVSEGLPVVLIHDAARALVDPAVVQQVAEAAAQHGAAIAAVPVAETVKEVDSSGCVRATPARDALWLARTPQGFGKDLILQAHRAARDEGFCATDDAQLVERLGMPVRIVQDSYDNLKITTPEDLAIAEAILRWRKRR